MMFISPWSTYDILSWDLISFYSYPENKTSNPNLRLSESLWPPKSAHVLSLSFLFSILNPFLFFHIFDSRSLPPSINIFCSTSWTQCLPDSWSAIRIVKLFAISIPQIKIRVWNSGLIWFFVEFMNTSALWFVRNYLKYMAYECKANNYFLVTQLQFLSVAIQFHFHSQSIGLYINRIKTSICVHDLPLDSSKSIPDKILIYGFWNFPNISSIISCYTHTLLRITEQLFHTVLNEPAVIIRET